ncbi:MAG: nicotinate-nucleotide adenylyltransferase [bacterium]
MARARSEVKVSVRTGFFGGTFNPIHHGHLIAAQLCLERLRLDRVLFVPTGIPPHKKQPVTGAKLRLKMTELAVENNPAFEVNDIEINQNETSYTIHTLQQLKKKNSDSMFYLIIGADEFTEFKSWHRWQEIIELVELAVINRPGYKLKIPQDIENYKVHNVQMPNIEISSSKLRMRCRQGLKLDYFVPEKVLNFIRENELYRE